MPGRAPGSSIGRGRWCTRTTRSQPSSPLRRWSSASSCAAAAAGSRPSRTKQRGRGGTAPRGQLWPGSRRLLLVTTRGAGHGTARRWSDPATPLARHTNGHMCTPGMPRGAVPTGTSKQEGRSRPACRGAPMIVPPFRCLVRRCAHLPMRPGQTRTPDGARAPSPRDTSQRASRKTFRRAAPPRMAPAPT